MNAAEPIDTTRAATARSWIPMFTIALGQMVMSFNISSLPVAMSGLMASFGVPATTVSTAIVVYSMAVAGFIMLGAKLNNRFGALSVFRGSVLVLCIAMILMTVSWSAAVMIAVQGLAGIASAALAPSLVALIAASYTGRQQETALGALCSARAAAGVAAFMIGGLLGNSVGWRPAFALVAIAAAAVLLLSGHMTPVRPNPRIRFDWFGAILVGASVVLISLGCNFLSAWGLGLATARAPANLLGLSPAPLMIIVGVLLGQAFIVWTRRRTRAGKTPLMALEIIALPPERAALLALFTIIALEAALNFAVPLYIQVIQGRSPLDSALAMMPFNLSVFVSALLIVRAYGRLTTRVMARLAFGLSALSLLWLAFVVRNDWSTVPVILGLIGFGIGQGALMTMLFNVLVSGAPVDLAADVGSLRGTSNNLAGAIGTAVIGALVVGLLSAAILREVAAHPELPPSLVAQVDLDRITFVSNDRLDEILAQTDATPAQARAAFEINVAARLQALRIGLLLMAGIAALALIPSGKLPDYRARLVPTDS